MERKKKLIQDMACAMLDVADVTDTLGEKLVKKKMANKVLLRPNDEKNHYELCKGRPTKIDHFKFFGRKCYIKRNEDKLGNCELRADEIMFLGYSFKRSGILQMMQKEN